MKNSERAMAGIGHNRPPDKVCKCCGQDLPAPRNRERHNLFFALLVPAFAQWPEAYHFQPMSTEHLRAWLLTEVGWCTTKDLEIGGPSKTHAANALRYFVNSDDKHKFFSMTAKGIRERRPKSINWNKCREADFKVILDKASEIIEAVVGVPVEQLKREVAA